MIEQYVRGFINLLALEGDQPRSAAEWKEAYLIFATFTAFMIFGFYMLSQS